MMPFMTIPMVYPVSSPASIPICVHASFRADYFAEM